MLADQLPFTLRVYSILQTDMTVSDWARTFANLGYFGLALDDACCFRVASRRFHWISPHGRGIAHQDLMIPNVMVDADSRKLVLIDFGLAQFEPQAAKTQRDVEAFCNEIVKPLLHRDEKVRDVIWTELLPCPSCQHIVTALKLEDRVARFREVALVFKEMRTADCTILLRKVSEVRIDRLVLVIKFTFTII
jgi:serine/threonine protein kinase